MSGDGQAPSRRIDKWLWCARRFKARSLAAKFVVEAGVRIIRGGVTHRINRSSFQLNEGDEVSFVLGERLFVLKVVGFAARRGSPEAAQNLFADLIDDLGKSPAAASPPCKAAGSR